MKKFIKPILYSLVFFILFTLIITLFNYFGILSGNLFKIFKVIDIITTFFINGFMIGKASNQKGWLNGLESGGFLIIILFIISLLFNIKLNIKLFIGYIILIAISVLGSMVGISKKTG